MKYLIFCFLIAISLVGCRSSHSTVELPRIKTDSIFIYQTDTVLRFQEFRDSIFVHDSISMRTSGDTVYIDRWHIKEAYKAGNIAAAHSNSEIKNSIKTDSISVPVYIDKVKYKNKIPSWIWFAWGASLAIMFFGSKKLFS